MCCFLKTFTQPTTQRFDICHVHISWRIHLKTTPHGLNNIVSYNTGPEDGSPRTYKAVRVKCEVRLREVDSAGCVDYLYQSSAGNGRVGLGFMHCCVL